jgi:outer membrane protein assembly factor BamB
MEKAGMSDSHPYDYWDRLILDRESIPAPVNDDDRTILAIDSLFPIVSAPHARAWARERVFERLPAPRVPDPGVISRSLVLNRSACAQRPIGILPPRRRWALLAAAFLLVLSAAGIWLGQGHASLLFGPNENDGGIIPAVSEQTGNIPMRGIDPGRTNVAPGPGVETTPVVLWSHAVEGSARTSPLVVDDVVYFGQSAMSPDQPGTILAVRADDGSLIWSHPTLHGLTAAFLLDAGTLYAIDDNGIVYAVDARTGDERWREAIQGDDVYRFTWYGAPLMVNGRLIVSSGSALAVSASDRSLFVGHPAEDWIEGDPHVYALSPIDGSVVWDVSGFPRNDSGGVISLSALDGSLLWSHAGEPAYLGPSYFDGVVFFGVGNPTALVALDAVTGRERWRTELASGVAWDGLGTPTVTGTAVIAGLTSGDVVGVDRESGTQLWVKHLFSKGSAYPLTYMQSDVAVAGDQVIAVGNGAIAAIDLADQSILWHVAAGIEGGRFSNLVVSGGTIFEVGTYTHGTDALIALGTPPESS